MNGLPKPRPLDRWLSLPRVAQITGLNERTLRAWCRAGRLANAWQPAGRAGSWYVPLRSLVERGVPIDLADVAEDAEDAETADDAELGAHAEPLKG